MLSSTAMQAASADTIYVFCYLVLKQGYEHVHQSSGSHQAIIRQLSGSRQASTTSGSCQAVVRQSSGSLQEIVRQSSGSQAAIRQVVVRQSLDSCQRFVKQSSGNPLTVVRQSSGSPLFINQYLYRDFVCHFLQLGSSSNNTEKTLFELSQEIVFLKDFADEFS